MSSTVPKRVEAAGKPPIWRRPMYRAVQKVQRNVWGRVFFDICRDPARVVYVCGSGRSGTTWLAEVVNYRNDHRYMFEPLTPPHVPEFTNFVRGQYLRADAEPRFAVPLDDMLSGRLRNRWVDRYNRVPLATRRVIKDVYANLLLEWVHSKHPDVRIVLILRHPMAVITSRLTLAPRDAHRRFEPELHRFLKQEELMQDHLSPFEGTIASAETRLEQQALWWAIENFVPLKQLGRRGLHVVHYEHLRSSPVTEIARLGRHLGRDFGSEVYERMQRRSYTTGRYSALRRGGDPATDWRQRWDRDDIRVVMKVLSLFGLDEMYADEAMPRRSQFVDTSIMDQEAAPLAFA